MTTWTSEVKGDGKYVDVNGIRLYVENHGAGRPLILLHGGLGSGEMFRPILGRWPSGIRSFPSISRVTAGPRTSTARSTRG